MRSAALFPEKNALWINERYYTYGQLLEELNSVYAKIPADGNFSHIAIYCNDDVQTYASILAVSIYGAAWIPLNDKFPAARNRKILEQSKADLILSSATHSIEEIAANIPVIATQQRTIETTELLQKTEQPFAYILFTSGSTGEPKGVPIKKENVNHFFDWYLEKYDFSSEDRFLQVYELSFDVSVFSFFMPLMVGACAYIVPGSGIKFVQIMKMLKEHRITVLSMVPSVLHFAEKYLDELNFPELRYSFFSGDSLYQDLALKWKKTLPNGQIHNFYGPTETTIVCTRHCWKDSDPAPANGIVPLGKAFDGLEILIVNEDLHPAQKGELCFSGTQVFSGYLEPSYDCFLMYNDKKSYRTGDIVSINEAGDLLFYGRSDQQVKISGFRVELKEVEMALRSVCGMNAIVLAVEGENGKKELNAFTETTSLNEKEINASLAEHLPFYMIPTRYVLNVEFPLNANGKVDRQKLLCTR
ncbi:MAG: amino acid adenylation domain-containing protein [Bacteroidota bacterium]|nr:amino acid adenylation domain-containing protein [Bacteroidota bacterium]